MLSLEILKLQKKGKIFNKSNENEMEKLKKIADKK